MNIMENEREVLDSLVQRVVGAVYEVSNVLGAGFFEKVYERSLLRELELRNIAARAEVRMPVWYKGQRLGEYIADLVVEDRLVVELKCVDAFAGEHMAQCLNYLRASGLKMALLVNFKHPKVAWRRVVWGI